MSRLNELFNDRRQWLAKTLVSVRVGGYLPDGQTHTIVDIPAGSILPVLAISELTDMAYLRAPQLQDEHNGFEMESHEYQLLPEGF